jgi:U3 small nucleolar RNA-associated protein 20
VREEPRSGHASFIEEAIAHWRETTSASDWAEVCVELNSYVQSLELICLHRDAIVDILLRRLRKQAALSIPALLAVLSALAQDLQADFVPYIPRMSTQLALLVSDATGDTTILEAVFKCIGASLKHVQAHLLEKVPWVLKHSRDLRYHESKHVRVFAAQVRSAFILLPFDPSQQAFVVSICDQNG